MISAVGLESVGNGQCGDWLWCPVAIRAHLQVKKLVFIYMNAHLLNKLPPVLHTLEQLLDVVPGSDVETSLVEKVKEIAREITGEDIEVDDDPEEDDVESEDVGDEDVGDEDVGDEDEEAE